MNENQDETIIDEALWEAAKDMAHKGFDWFNQIEIHEAEQ